MFEQRILRRRWLALAVLLAVSVALGSGSETRPTTIYIVRHAEKDRSDPVDPTITAAGRERAKILSQTLRSVPLAAIYATELKRTQETVKPTAERTGIVPKIIERANVEELVARLQNDHAGQSVLVAGHSHSVPGLLAALGVNEKVYLGSADYDRLFVVIHRGGESPLLLRLHYGAFTEGKGRGPRRGPRSRNKRAKQEKDPNTNTNATPR